tara:strand:- start:219 stop:335 length:117 start_codon:yes stop_codon:yes gene_type:complete
MCQEFWFFLESDALVFDSENKIKDLALKTPDYLELKQI